VLDLCEYDDELPGDFLTICKTVPFKIMQRKKTALSLYIPYGQPVGRDSSTV
jgi:hypothetical protein